MKDIKITARRQKLELLTLLVCIIIAELLNVYAIIAYDGKWSQLITSIGYVLAFGVLLYLSWSALRITWSILRKITKKSK